MRRLVSPILLVAVAAIACDQDTPLGMQQLFQPATPQDVPLAPSADTYLRQGEPNQNQGTETILRVRNSGNNRALLRWDPAVVTQAIGTGTLISARIELAITGNGDNWGTNGRTINVHRMTTAWTESGATWNCAVDANVTNQRDDCSGATAWVMGNPSSANPWVATPTATQTIRNQQTGTVTFDVTADVAAMATGGGAQFGWIIKKADEGANGLVDFGSKESASGPRLVLAVQAAVATQKLIVVSEAGVTTTPGVVETRYPTGATATYAFHAQPGYADPVVYLDGELVPASGSVVMDTTHMLMASAARVLALQPGTENLVASARALLTAPNPVTAYQDHIYQVVTSLTIGDPDLAHDALTAVYQHAFDPVRDSVALDALDSALAGHTFEVPLGTVAGAAVPHSMLLAAAATGASDELTTYEYINGIKTTFDQGFGTWFRLRALIIASPVLNTPQARYRYRYNRTREETELTGDAKRLQCLTEEMDFATFKPLFDRCMQERRFSTEPDIMEAIRQWVDVVDHQGRLEEDAQALRADIVQYQADGSHVILVPHSQGNLMAEQALQSLDTAGVLNDPGDSVFVGVVALASPRSTGWPLDAHHLLSVNVKGDLVPIAGLSSWETIPTPLSNTAQSAIDEINSDPFLIFHANLLAHQMFYWGFNVLHSVDMSYLGQPVVRDAIRDDLEMLYREATVGAVQCGFAGETVYPGRGRGLAKYVTVLNRNGRPLHGRVLQWSSSNEAVAGVSNNGDVTTHNPGTSVITVQSWQASCQITYTVIPEPDLRGTWVGQWKKTDFNGPPDSGTVTLTITQNGIYVLGDVSYTFGATGYGPFPYDGGILTSQPGFEPTIQLSFAAPEYAPTGGYYVLNVGLTLRGGLLTGGGNVTYFGTSTGVTRSWILHKVLSP